jgi:hypothetical protein
MDLPTLGLAALALATASLWLASRLLFTDPPDDTDEAGEGGHTTPPEDWGDGR